MGGVPVDGCTPLEPIGTNGLVVAVGTDDVLPPDTPVVVEPSGILVVAGAVTGGVPFETTTVTLEPPLGVETNVVLSVAGTLDSPGPTGGNVTGPGGTDVTPGEVVGGTCVLAIVVGCGVP